MRVEAGDLTKRVEEILVTTNKIVAIVPSEIINGFVAYYKIIYGN